MLIFERDEFAERAVELGEAVVQVFGFGGRFGSDVGVEFSELPRGEFLLLHLFASEPLDFGAQQIPRNGPHPRTEGRAGFELIQMPVSKNKSVVREFIHELRHGRFECEKGADVRQVRVEERGKRVVIAGLGRAEETRFVTAMTRLAFHFKRRIA